MGIFRKNFVIEAFHRIKRDQRLYIEGGQTVATSRLITDVVEPGAGGKLVFALLNAANPERNPPQIEEYAKFPLSFPYSLNINPFSKSHESTMK